MRKIAKDENREHRIVNDIVVDAYGEEERVMGWYYYLEDKLILPCSARCREVISTSPLDLNDSVIINSMADVDVCSSDMYVTVDWRSRRIDVPLRQLDVVDSDDDTQEAISDWHYWIAQGYHF